MRITCPDCEERVPMWAVELATGAAVCERCRTLFDCSDRLPERLNQAREHASVALPEGFTIETLERSPGAMSSPYRRVVDDQEIGALIIRRRWWPSARGRIGRFVFIVIFGALLVANGGALDGADFFLFSYIFMAIFVASLVASLVADRVNSSTIRVDADMLETRHGPLSPRPTTRLRTRQLVGFGCLQVDSEQEVHGEPGPPSFTVHARVRGEAPIELATQLPEAKQALFIARRLEKHLGLEGQG